MKRFLSIVGARPQFIKAAAVHDAFARHGGVDHGLLHTGQHYDAGMSQVFFDELAIPHPRYNLGIGSASPAEQIGRMIIGLEEALAEARPEMVIVYGDTNSTLAGAITANKLRLPVAHVEAGLRSYNGAMPEEANRVLCDHCSDWLFCPTDAAVANLRNEGIVGAAQSHGTQRVEMTGDVMLDTSLRFASLASQRSRILSDLGLSENGYFLATIHRNFNADDPVRLHRILKALRGLAEAYSQPVIVPVHPRTRERITAAGLHAHAPNTSFLRLIPPVGYFDMVQLERHARLVLTDSGGVQKEAFFFKRPCVLLRAETEWTELVEHGQARLADADPERIMAAAGAFLAVGLPACPALFGDGHAADRIAAALS